MQSPQPLATIISQNQQSNSFLNHIMSRYKFKLLHKNDKDFSNFEGYLTELEEMKNLFSNNTDGDISISKEFHNDFIFIDMTIDQILMIVKILKEVESKNVKTLWEKKQLSDTDGIFAMNALINNLANSLWIIRMLLSKGSDFQAKIILRYFIEQFDLLIAILGDNDFFNNYIKVHNYDDPFLDFNHKWYNYEKPKKLKPIIKKIFEKTIKNEKLGFLLSHFKDSNYEWLSLYSHGHSGTLVVGSIIFNDKGEAVENEYCSPDYKLHFTLNKIIIHAGLAISAIYDILIGFHKINEDISKELLKEVVNKQSYYSKIYYKNIVKIYLEDTRDDL